MDLRSATESWERVGSGFLGEIPTKTQGQVFSVGSLQALSKPEALGPPIPQAHAALEP